MYHFIKPYCGLLASLAFVFALSVATFAQDAAQKTPSAVVFPAPAEESLSDDFDLAVNHQKVPLYQCRVSAMPFNQVWPGYQRPVDQTELASFAYWDMTGPVDIELVSRRPIESVAIRPTARGIQPKVDGNRITFRLESPQQITVEVNGWHNALHLFANAPQANVPSAQTPGVRFFGPGVHRPGKIVLKSDETLYLADGAVVYGAVEAKNASNLRIAGHGILDTSEFERQQAGGCIRLTGCTSVAIEGVVLRDPNVWCASMFSCSKVNISNIKLIGLWRYNSDGIDICNSQDVTVRNCFVRSFDDSLVIKGLGDSTDPVRNVLVENCVVWNDWGRALEIGAETCAPEISNVVFRDCDIVRISDIAMDVQHGDRAAVRNILFENIRLEMDDVYWRYEIQKSRDAKFAFNTNFCPTLLVLEIVKTMWSHDQIRGTMENVTVRNCSVTGKLHPASRFRGFDAEHAIRNVAIENLTINGQVVRELKDADIHVGPYVHDVRIGPK